MNKLKDTVKYSLFVKRENCIEIDIEEKVKELRSFFSKIKITHYEYRSGLYTVYRFKILSYNSKISSLCVAEKIERDFGLKYAKKELEYKNKEK